MADSICKVGECASPIRTAGMCNKHYIRMRKHGNPLVMKRAPNGCGTLNSQGYRHIHGPRGTVKQHILVAERALGRPLPSGAEVHHVNEKKSDNRPENLVICPDRSYHQLLHVRTRAYQECGHADWRRCSHCREYDSPDRLKTDGFRYYHRVCRTAYLQELRNRRREAAR